MQGTHDMSPNPFTPPLPLVSAETFEGVLTDFIEIPGSSIDARVQIEQENPHLFEALNKVIVAFAGNDVDLVQGGLLGSTITYMALFRSLGPSTTMPRVTQQTITTIREKLKPRNDTTESMWEVLQANNLALADAVQSFASDFSQNNKSLADAVRFGAEFTYMALRQQAATIEDPRVD